MCVIFPSLEPDLAAEVGRGAPALVVLGIVESLGFGGARRCCSGIEPLLQSSHSLFDQAPVRDELLEHLEGVLGVIVGLGSVSAPAGPVSGHASGGISPPLMIPFTELRRPPGGGRGAQGGITGARRGWHGVRGTSVDPVASTEATFQLETLNNGSNVVGPTHVVDVVVELQVLGDFFH